MSKQTGAVGTPWLEVDTSSDAVLARPSTPTLSTQPTTAAAPLVVTTPPVPLPPLLARARAEGVTGPAVVALSAVLVAAGVVLDLRGIPSPGLGTTVAVVLVALGAPAVVRFRALLTAAVLPPLLLAAALAGIAQLGGRNRGLRDVGLDVGTTLALSAPLLFSATGLCLLVVLGRVVRRLTRR